jgi:hypothetical protein
MADPSELAALEALRTTLAGITTTGGAYKSTVNAVEYHYRTWEDAARAGLTIIGMVPGKTMYVGEQGGRLRATCTVTLVCHTVGTTHASCYRAIQLLTDDVIKAVYSDHTLGGNVFDSRVVSSESDIGDPDTFSHLGRSATAVVTVELQYDRTTGGS